MRTYGKTKNQKKFGNRKARPLCASAAVLSQLSQTAQAAHFAQGWQSPPLGFFLMP
jgi:hypothetical protein